MHFAAQIYFAPNYNLVEREQFVFGQGLTRQSVSYNPPARAAYSPRQDCPA